MKKVSLRNFQLKPSKYINDLPIALTRYGKVIAFIKKKLNGKTVKKLIEKKKRVRTCLHGYPIHICQKCRKK